MVDLTEDAIEMFNNQNCDKTKPLVWISTVEVMDKEGNPHLAPVCYTKVINKNKLLVAINFANKTMYNVETYSRVAFGIAKHYEGFLIKGSRFYNKKGFTI